MFSCACFVIILVQCFFLCVHPSVLQSHHSHLKAPNVGDQTTILPTCVLNVNEFYGQLGREFQALRYFERQLNARQTNYENEQYTTIPGKIIRFSLKNYSIFKCMRKSSISFPAEISELVLVLLENGLFYRAKVLNCVQLQITVNIIISIENFTIIYANI